MGWVWDAVTCQVNATHWTTLFQTNMQFKIVKWNSIQPWKAQKGETGSGRENHFPNFLFLLYVVFKDHISSWTESGATKRVGGKGEQTRKLRKGKQNGQRGERGMSQERERENCLEGEGRYTSTYTYTGPVKCILPTQKHKWVTHWASQLTGEFEFCSLLS